MPTPERKIGARPTREATMCPVNVASGLWSCTSAVVVTRSERSYIRNLGKRETRSRLQSDEASELLQRLSACQCDSRESDERHSPKVCSSSVAVSEDGQLNLGQRVLEDVYRHTE